MLINRQAARPQRWRLSDSPGMIPGLSQLHWHTSVLGTTMVSLVTYPSKLVCVLYKAPLDMHGQSSPYAKNCRLFLLTFSSCLYYMDDLGKKDSGFDAQNV